MSTFYKHFRKIFPTFFNRIHFLINKKARFVKMSAWIRRAKSSYSWKWVPGEEGQNRRFRAAARGRGQLCSSRLPSPDLCQINQIRLVSRNRQTTSQVNSNYSYLTKRRIQRLSHPPGCAPNHLKNVF